MQIKSMIIWIYMLQAALHLISHDDVNVAIEAPTIMIPIW